MIRWLIVLLISGSSISNAQYITPKDGWFPFVTPFPDYIINTTYIGKFILDPPAGHRGKVLLKSDGHIYFEDGTRAKFFGTNLCFSAAFPKKDIAEVAAAHIAKQGFNIVRFHHIDEALSSVQGSSSSQHINQEVLTKFDYFFKKLKEKGIFGMIDFYSIRQLKPDDGIPFHDSLNPYLASIKRVLMFYPPAYTIIRNYLYNLLSHINPYTGLAYKDEPALVFINPINEITLLDHYFWSEWDNPSSENYLPQFYKRELKAQWNDWLYKKYHSQRALVRSWLGDTSKGVNLLINGEFSDYSKDIPLFWFFNQLSGKSRHGIEKTELSHEPALYFDVISSSEYNWHIQLCQNNISIFADSTYNIQFKSKSNRNLNINVVVQQDRPPWDVYYTNSVNITTYPMSYNLSFYAVKSDTVQLAFNLGSDTGKIWLDDIQFRRGPFSHILDPDETLSRGNINLINWKDRYSYSAFRIFDQIRFFYEKESEFYRRIYSLLRDTLKVYSLISSSFFWSSQLNLGVSSNMADVLDAHPYFDHPTFPNKPWDIFDFRITNKFFGENENGEMMFNISNICASFEKPMILSEWQHVTPNESQHVSLIPFSGYIALRDYDGLINFNIADNEFSFSNNNITGFFNSSGNPIFFILLRMAALAFLRDVEPEDIDRTHWQSYSFEILLRDIYVGSYWQKAILSSPRDRRFKQFYWNSKKGVFYLNTTASKAFTGRTAGDTAIMGGIKIVGGSDGTFAVSRIDTGSTYVTFLVSALARSENTNMIWRDSTKNTGMLNWGNTPYLMEPVIYYTNWNADSLQISKLTPNGDSFASFMLNGGNHKVSWTVKTGIDSVPWYRVIAYGYLDFIR